MINSKDLIKLLTGETLIETVAAIACFIIVLILWNAFLPNEAINSRARAHAKRRDELRTRFLSAPQQQRAPRQRPLNMVRDLVERFKLNQGDEGRRVAEFLTRAGWRTPDAVTLFLGFLLATPMVLGIAVFVFLPFWYPTMTPLIRALLAFAGMGAGAFAPSLYVRNAITKRYHQIQRAMPDALDLFVICAEAGLSLDAAITRVSRETAPSTPELSDEFGLTAVELGFLPNRAAALNNLLKRADLPAIRGLVNTLAQTEKYGTPLVQALRVLAAEFRNVRMMKAEEKAARLPATLTVPMMLFILPPLFVILIGPAIIQVLSTFPHGLDAKK